MSTRIVKRLLICLIRANEKHVMENGKSCLWLHLADVQRRDTDLAYYTDGSLRRWSTARYRSRLLYRRFTSPMINGEIPMPFIIQTVHFGDDQRRNTDAFYYTRAQKRMGGETPTQLLSDVWCEERLGRERSITPTVQKMAAREVWSLMQKRACCKRTVKHFNLLFMNRTLNRLLKL